MDVAPEEIGKRMDALRLWGALLPFNWAVKPSGTAFPYFCSVMAGDGAPVQIRFLMLEGWQTLHDYVRTRDDANFGFYSTPAELPHLELVILKSGGMHLFRHDTGYVPAVANGAQRELAAKILWESYGIMLRIESDPKLPMKFAGEKAVFARIEDPPGKWSDAPLVIPDPPPYVEKIAIGKDDIKAAQDLPFASGEALEVDFRIVPGLQTSDGQRPRCVYQLIAADSATGAKEIDLSVSVSPDGGLKSLWEAMPPQLLKALMRRGRIPGELRVKSGRVFRFLRPLCIELPFKLSLHDSLSRV